MIYRDLSHGTAFSVERAHYCRKHVLGVVPVYLFAFGDRMPRWPGVHLPSFPLAQS